jgi:hypothetical protein
MYLRPQSALYVDPTDAGQDNNTGSLYLPFASITQALEENTRRTIDGSETRPIVLLPGVHAHPRDVGQKSLCSNVVITGASTGIGRHAAGR